MEKQDAKALPLALLGLGKAFIEVGIVDEVKRHPEEAKLVAGFIGGAVLGGVVIDYYLKD